MAEPLAGHSDHDLAGHVRDEPARDPHVQGGARARGDPGLGRRRLGLRGHVPLARQLDPAEVTDPTRRRDGRPDGDRPPVAVGLHPERVAVLLAADGGEDDPVRLAARHLEQEGPVRELRVGRRGAVGQAGRHGRRGGASARPGLDVDVVLPVRSLVGDDALDPGASGGRRQLCYRDRPHMGRVDDGRRGRGQHRLRGHDQRGDRQQRDPGHPPGRRRASGCVGATFAAGGRVWVLGAGHSILSSVGRHLRRVATRV
jgi:hypothetical protein